MRTIGDEELSRRTSIEEYVTAEDSESSASLPSSDASSFVSTEDVVQLALDAKKAAPTKAGQMTRNKWTNEMNRFILRSYFINNETDKRKYLQPLHEEFIRQFPDMKISRQRLGDQRRAIVRNKLLNDGEIAQIRNDVERYFQNSGNRIEHGQEKELGQRKKVSSEVNETIIRTYYRITNLERDKTAYRQILHKTVLDLHPELSDVSIQRIADQRRVIISNTMISNDRLEQIRDEVESELHHTKGQNDDWNINTQNTDNTHLHTNPETQSRTPPAHIETPPVPDNESSPEILLTGLGDETYNPTSNFSDDSSDKSDPEINKTFSQAYEFYKNIEPTQRHIIPKQRSSKKLAYTVNYLNKNVLHKYVDKDSDFSVFQTTLYCAAWTAAKINGAKLQIPPIESNRKTRKNKPKWQIRLERKIETLRAKIARLIQYINGNRSPTLNKHIQQILQHYQTHTTHEAPNTDLTHYLDTLKQKLTVASSRLKRYKTCTLRKNQNTQFKYNEKLFYRTLQNSSTNHTNTTNQTGKPHVDELRDYWSGIWERPVEHNVNAPWIRNEQIRMESVEPMEFEIIPIEIFQNVLKKLNNWKSPGTDKIHNYWIKKYTYLHPFLHNHINTFIQNPQIMPRYITTGITYMLPKDQKDLTNPAKYRPITCLQTIYKITTACLAQIIYEHTDRFNILTEQQKGCRKLSQGCKEQLIIDSVVLQQVQRKKKDLFTMYIDYKKAYDSVPHSWLLKVLEIYKLHPHIISFLEVSMQSWTTKLKLNTLNESIETDPIKIQRGIFQGDALSPL
ncbi:hypothetical protein ABMA28_006097 [Loxostege sticticalis]|uniref:Reverse transcriptase domain-containing protein n=1 Tax=Loxostege sticticalis TaxID=481309 RepID=A0ABD0SJZ6_LOXSC